MSRATLWHHASSVGAVSVLTVSVLLRLVAGGPFVGATLLALIACGLALLPIVPRELAPIVKAAIVPALALASYGALLTTVSIMGFRLTYATITLSVALLVGAALAITVVAGRRAPLDGEGTRVTRRDVFVAVALAAIVAVAIASAWDVAYPLQVRGTDLGHYLLYADEVAAQERLLVDDPYAGEDGRVFADPAAVGAVYGSFLILDGLSSWTLGAGLLVLSAISVLGVFAAAGGLWGHGAGLVAAAAYTVAPIRLDPMYWHGLGTTFALVFVPLVGLALGLMLRGQRGWQAVGLLAVSLVGVAAAHSTSAVVVAAFVAVALAVDLVRILVRRKAVRGTPTSWWTEGIVRPVLAAVALAALAGVGVIAHVIAQARDLGTPVDYRFLGPDWLDRAAIAGYFSWRFLGLAAVAIVLVLSSARMRRDPAFLSPLALALACVVVNESWRVAFPFEYRRVVYYLAIALVLTIGAAFVRFRPRVVWIGAWALALLFVAQLSIGLRLPQRVLDGAGPGPAIVPTLRQLREDLDSGRLPDTDLVVTDACLHFAVPYLVQRPTIPAFGERQVGFENRLPLARQASEILAGGDAGRELAASLGVGYAIVDPGCEPDLEQRLGGTVVVENDEVVVLRLPGRA